MSNPQYPTDLTDNPWKLVNELIPPAKSGGRLRRLEMRLVLNAILSVVVGGIQWRLLPREYPPWKSVYHDFRPWRDSGDWQRLHDTRRIQVRQQAGRHKQPTAGCLDSQHVKTTQIPGERGYDAGKQVKGRKRPLLVDTLGLLVVIVVTAASASDTAGARLVFQRWRGIGKQRRLIGVDGSDRGHLLTWVASRFRFRLRPILRHDDQQGFMVLPRRWVVERTFGWFNLHRCLSKDYEVLPASREAISYITMIRLSIRRLAAP